MSGGKRVSGRSPRDGRGAHHDETLPDHLFRWSEALSRRLAHEMGVAADPALAGLTGRRARLLQLIPPDGLRASELADRARTTRQALGQLVDVLEGMGLVESVTDPADARVRLVRRTPAGEAASAEVTRAIAAAEQALRDDVGARRYDAMVETMRLLARDVEL
ncbi:MarR family winged helix-turn-helix transcriptional regulator [Terracoccus luteus]|uniref:DNA-binding MarR family transcriptional regulator n=1 Tax=Terracoccus luteus TaxID=53356 RepID=A0A839PR69_9MICO|nr:MarR family transcriptional regulator [Terracoccus luteus]MBB2985559.1 DNA-binding MarR family transcriptional regulator [Terracoccus luteus]MCP2171211.1 DNA-binding MarR family transcriptional regulator [Terracoccus luteus]